MSVQDKIAFLIPEHMLEPSAVQQIYAVAKEDFIDKMAVLPDCHTGFYMPIGTVARAHNMICPAAVGYDIGCGMNYVNTGLTIAEVPAMVTPDARAELLKQMHKEIPCGFNKHKRAVGALSDFESGSGSKELEKAVNGKMWKQVGTLGGGNHFIEIGLNDVMEVCVSIHSGSRKPGYLIAEYYMGTGSFKKYKKDRPLWVEADSDLGLAYIEDMNWALDYALHSRMRMLIKTLTLMGLDRDTVDFLALESSNETHNHARVDMETGYVLHRKGATEANKGQIGIIPGDRASGVYVTRGLGNQHYLSTSSHGAGRLMSRAAAKKNLDVAQYLSQVSGVVTKASASSIDEAPDAYKDVHEVVRMQEGEVIEVLDHIRPMISFKDE